MQYSSEAEYLGVRVEASGVTEGATLERLRSAEGRIRQMRAAGIVRPRLSVARLISIYQALIKPVWSYALHVTPYTAAVDSRAKALLDAATQWIYPKLQKHSRHRMRRLLGIEDADITRRVQLRKMVSRIQSANADALADGDMGEVVFTTHDAQMAVSLMTNEASETEPYDEQIRRWTALEDSRARRRRVAAPTAVALHPIWALPSPRHAVCAANWILGRFPPDRQAARWFLGSANYARLDRYLRPTFIKSDWGKDDERRVVEALEAMSDYWPAQLRLFRTTPR